MSDAPAPRANPDLIGQAAAEAAFLEAWNGGRLAHAWLLTGPRGIGKASLAYRIARFALAGGGAGGALFGPPASLAVPADDTLFRRVAGGGHADLKVVERGWADDKQVKRRGEIVIDDVRGIGGFLSLTPAEGGWRVVIVDAADEMNRNAANAVLKVLEEPPRRALMLLVAHSPGRLLPTIRSRCRRLPLKPLGDDQVTTLLGRYAPHLPQADLAPLARLAEGSIGRALALADEGGLGLYRDLIGLLAGLPRLDIPALHTFADKMGRDADAFLTLGELLAWWLARLARAGADGEVVAGEGVLMDRLLAAAPLDRWVELWEKVTRLFARAEAVNLDRKQVVLSAFLAVERALRS